MWKINALYAVVKNDSSRVTFKQLHRLQASRREVQGDKLSTGERGCAAALWPAAVLGVPQQFGLAEVLWDERNNSKDYLPMFKVKWIAI